MKLEKLLSLIFLTSMAMTLTGCLGSEKPRTAIRQVKRSQIYVPPIDPELLVPSSLKKSNLDFYKRRSALRASLKNPDINPWQAAERDIKRIGRLVRRKR